MTKKASITAVGHYLPETILSNAELEKTLDKNPYIKIKK